MVLPNPRLAGWLDELNNGNAQGEYYLTDIVAMAIEDGLEVASVEPEMAFEVEGVNDRVQLAALEREYQAFQAKQLMQQGVHLIDPSRFDLRGQLTAGQDVRIDINVIIEGDCELGDNVEIGAGCVIKNTKIAAGTKVQPYSVFDHAVIGENAQIGPFSRLRPGAKLANEVHIGNFVEVKNSSIGLGSKANHFTYLGDAEVGAGSNIGAGTITCNYDGANKFKTIIGDAAFIGSNRWVPRARLWVMVPYTSALSSPWWSTTTTGTLPPSRDSSGSRPDTVQRWKPSMMVPSGRTTMGSVQPLVRIDWMSSFRFSSLTLLGL